MSVTVPINQTIQVGLTGVIRDDYPSPDTVLTDPPAMGSQFFFVNVGGIYDVVIGATISWDGEGQTPPNGNYYGLDENFDPVTLNDVAYHPFLTMDEDTEGSDAAPLTGSVISLDGAIINFFGFQFYNTIDPDNPANGTAIGSITDGQLMTQIGPLDSGTLWATTWMNSADANGDFYSICNIGAADSGEFDPSGWCVYDEAGGTILSYAGFAFNPQWYDAVTTNMIGYDDAATGIYISVAGASAETLLFDEGDGGYGLSAGYRLFSDFENFYIYSNFYDPQFEGYVIYRVKWDLSSFDKLIVLPVGAEAQNFFEGQGDLYFQWSNTRNAIIAIGGQAE